MNKTHALGQYMTPFWAAEELVSRYFHDLTATDVVIEPSCGTGAFLRAIPAHVTAVGVEIDPDLASTASLVSGREVIVGDFCAVEPRVNPTVVIGNPPFAHSTIMAFLDRAFDILPAHGRVGMILPCFALQTASTVVRLAERWSIEVDLLPRNLFPRLKHPICFAVLRKSTAGALKNLTLYQELHSVHRLRRRYRELLASGQASSWAAVVLAALECLGGTASLPEIYGEVEPCRPTANAFWRERVRATLQKVAIRTGRGLWALPHDHSNPYQPSLLTAA